jgi:hypothetical protein
MGGKQIRKTGMRIVETHFHHRGGGASQLAAIFDFAERVDHGVRVFGELDRAGVRQIFARARQRKPDHDRENPGQRDDRKRDQNRYQRAAALLVARRARPIGASGASRVEHEAEGELADERNNAGQHHCGDQEFHVAVADMGQLVRKHRFDFAIVEPVEEAARNRDRILLLVQPGRVGVQRRVLGDLQLRHRNAARDAEVFKKIIELRLFLAGHAMRAGLAIDQPLMNAISDKKPDDGADRGKGDRIDEVAKGCLQNAVERRVTIGERFEDQRAGKGQQVNEKKQSDDQKHRADPVRADMRIKTVSGHRSQDLLD